MITEITTKPETVTIDRVLYIVEIANTPEDHEKEGRPSAARLMRSNKHAFHLYLRRPKGTRRYFTVQALNGQFAPVTSLKGIF